MLDFISVPIRERLMNINFYLHSPSKKDGRADFIGRLEWAGAYCFPCDISLATGKKGGVDVTDPKNLFAVRYDECPTCARSLNDQYSTDRLDPTEEEILEQERHPWPVRFATAFRYALPIKFVRNMQRDTAVITHGGVVMTADVFKKKFLDTAKFHFSPPKK